MPLKQQHYIQKFKRNHYDQIALLVPRGRKEDIKAFASQMNLSMNAMMNKMLQSAMSMTDNEWRNRPNEITEGGAQS